MRPIAKSFALLPLVLCVVCGLAISSASAASFHSEVEPTIITGSNSGEGGFQIAPADHTYVATCSNSEKKGTMPTKTVTSLTLHPTLAGCESSLGASPIDTSGCSIIIDANTNATGHLPMTWECNGTNKVKITSPGCTLSFEAQAMTRGAKATNIGAGSTRAITLDMTATGTFSKSGFACFVISGTTATFSGNMILRGYKDSGIFGEISEGATYSEGSQVGIWWE